MNHYEEGINTIFEKVEAKESEPTSQPKEEENWKEFAEMYSHSRGIVQSEYGILNMSEDAMKDVSHGENLNYKEYLIALSNSVNIKRNCFEYCYYSNAWYSFKGQISRFSKKKDKVIFKRIYISGGLMDGDCFEGKEDHVWMDIESFDMYQVGDCLSFCGEIYRYLKTRNGKQISFGIRKPFGISKINSYELPSDDDLILQSIKKMICEICMFNEYCNMELCIANRKWHEDMKKMLFNVAKGKAK